jgi:hypothetical protein
VIDHVGFEVADRDGLVRHLREHSVTLLDQSPVEVPELNASILFCLGPDAERIEVFQYDE